MMVNKRGEQMVEAAMVLPLLILVILSILFVMIHDYDMHQKQITAHKELIQLWDQPTTVLKIKKKTIETSTKISGAVNFPMKESRTCRSYMLSPTSCIRVGEMISFDEKK